MIKKYKYYIIVFILFLLALVPSVYLLIKYMESEHKLKNLQSSPSDQNIKIMAEVSKLIILPEGETPTIATISDKDKLSNQPFFASAKNGDIVLIYAKAKKAILYDPIAKKIIDMAPLTVTSPSPSSSTPSASLIPVSLILYNGTQKTGLTKKYEDSLTKLVPQIRVLDRDNAFKKDYQTSLLVDIKGNQTEQAQKLADNLKLTLSNLPPGETASTGADFLIILGTDQE